MKKISDYIGVALIVLSIAILSVGLIWFASAFLLDYEPPLWCIVADVALFVIIAICYVVRDNAWRKERLDEEFALGCDYHRRKVLRDAVDATVSMRQSKNGKDYYSFDTNYTDLPCNEGENVKLTIVKKS